LTAEKRLPPRTERLAQSVAVMPGEHWVPADMSMTTLQRPEAQRWNEVPLMQFHAPSSEQAASAVWTPSLVPVDGLVCVGVAAGVDDVGVLVGDLVTVARVVELGLGRNTPPGLEKVC
jgi:hypothetical protein